MAALPLFKLLCKTCSGSVNPARYIPTIRFLSADRNSTRSAIESRKFADRPKRSYSTPSRTSFHKISKKGKEQCMQERKISRSVENLKNYRRNEDRDIPAFRYAKPADEVQDVVPTEDFIVNEIEPEPEPPKPEINFESNVRYELTSTARSTEENYSDVLGYMMDYERKKPMKIFPHLQPFNIKPYGSNETMMFPVLPKRPTRIVYPPNAFIDGGTADSSQAPMVANEEPEMPDPTSIDKGFEKNLSTYVQEKEYPGYEDAKKMVVCETPSKTQQNLSRKNYSTTAVRMPSSDKPKGPSTIANFAFQGFSGNEVQLPKPVLRHPLLKEIRSSVIKKKQDVEDKPAVPDVPDAPPRRYKIGELFINSALKLDLPHAANKTVMDKVKMDAFYGTWPAGIDLNHFDKKPPAVKSRCGEVERHQTTVKKSRSHTKSSTKITYSTGLLSRSRHALPIQNTVNRKNFASSACKDETPQDDCYCKEYVTVKLGELQEECIKAGKCKPPKPKTGRLPKFVPADCPCKEDPPLKVGKPLVPLKKRYEPKARPWTCDQFKVSTQPRADDNYTLREKRLPKLAAAPCPITESKWKDLKIRRLPKRKIVDPPRISPQPEVPEEQVRADDFLKTEKPKKLPVLKPQSCPRLDDHCPPPEKPLPRLKPIPFCEKPKIFQEDITHDVPRADDGLVLKPKKLPVHKPHDYPSPKPIDMPPVPLKRIKWVPIPEPVRVQPPAVEEDLCILQRADDDLTLTPKKLPLLPPSICPCSDEPPPQPSKPLPRLKFKPVYEKPKISTKYVHSISRADEGLIVKPKKLPTYKAKEIPCPEIRPLPVKPLARRARIKFKPIVEERKVVCLDVASESPRADDGLVMLPKKLPVHKPQRSPCPEYCPPPEKPLPRLKAKPIQDPPKCDSKPTCEERIVRADEGLTVLPKLLPVLKATSCPPPVQPLNATAPKLARLKFKPIQEPEKINPVPEAYCNVVERADEHDWIYWRKLDVGKGETCQKSESSTETSLIVRPEDCLNDDSWLPPVSYDEMTGKRTISCGMSSKRSYCTSCCHQNTLVTDIRLFTAEDIFDIKTLPTKSKPVDKVGILVCNNSKVNSGHANEPLARTPSRSNGVNAPVFNSLNTSVSRFVSTYKNLQQKVPPTTPPSLQPKKKMITEREKFIGVFPDDAMIENARAKGRDFAPPDKSMDDCQDDKRAGSQKLCSDDEAICPPTKGKDECDDPCDVKTLTLWQRIVNFFKARDCPSPEEFRKMRLREDAERAARKAGLCVYDPLQCKANGEELPKVQTVDCDDENDKKEKKRNC